MTYPTREIFCKTALPPDLVEPFRIRGYLCRRNESNRYRGYYTLREDTCPIADFCIKYNDLSWISILIPCFF